MTRFLLGVAVVVIGGLSGCASPARYIERSGDTGVVAIPTNSDTWPNFNRREAMALIQKHVGSNFEITEEREVATGKRTFNDQHVNNEQTWNSTNPLLPANRQTVQNTTTTQDVTEYRIAYRRKSTAPRSLGSHETATAGGRAPSSPVVPSVQQPQQPLAPAAGIQPSGGMAVPAGPTAPVVPAGGPIPPNNPGAPAGVVPAGPIAPPIPMGGPIPPNNSGVYGSAGLTIGSMR